MRFAFKIAYDGFYYHGYARQPSLKTIEGEFTEFLIINNLIESLIKSQFRVSSRTDKQVSSLGNVISFYTKSNPKDIIKIVNTSLTNIFVYGYKEVDDDFNPRHAKWRSYRYYIKDNDLDIDLLLDCASHFTGAHNFQNFARIEPHRNPVRTIDNLIIEQKQEVVIIDIFAQTFLWHQIRRIIAAMIKVAKDEITTDAVLDSLKNPDSKVDYGLAPAHPLILTNVQYGFDFNFCKDYQKMLEEIENKVASRVLN